MRQQQQQPAQRGGRGNASRLQPVGRDASFGSGSAGCIPEAEFGAGASGAPNGGGSSSGQRSPELGHHHPTFGQSLRTGSFRFQVCYKPQAYIPRVCPLSLSHNAESRCPSARVLRQDGKVLARFSLLIKLGTGCDSRNM